MTEPREQPDDLRQLFADATSDIRPRGSLDDILERTKKVDPMARRWFLPVVAVAAVIGFVIGGAVWLANDPTNHGTDRDPAGTPAPTTASPTPATRSGTVYYLGHTRSGLLLYPETTTLESADGVSSGFTLDAARKAVSGKPSDPDYFTAWPAGIHVVGASSCDGSGCELQVTFDSPDVQDRPVGMSEAEAKLSVEQLVRSAVSANSTDDTVFFAAETPGGTVRLDRVLGVDVARSRGIANDDAVLAPVQISSPGNGVTVPAGDLTVTGVASTFEANVVWELKVGGDTVVQQGHTTATECCTLSPYTFTIKNLQPGTYTLVVHDQDMSGSGKPVNQDTKDIVVR